ncbi:SAM-dependent methyltransferase [Mycobacterium nebraskense]|uniref:S-adenosyl-L-methionine-dependent methyltransferase n=1 Tax=Mycobacterium nebraskense TaxID=244292 RepID=A0A0F5NHP8_9MYCO|nr:class I SAM-dependent methyltransferase [Mycobacterium nebraskense]KKC06482.1 SAM-dependent methyltransferase [Mycobacterium nebraskense]KLO42136.1 SAM-dependent methyltransferase [Mycobacterium nebraskense]MBI2694639.1 class I SAM-dependent methyltransferase [Mycobacterium nebraskense]MCV7117506.1 class I SAM-dependent methyltransferase [Mycobacterium nebraskense]ORW17561.1 SAM-dependent methyltransferase [Mycobacterium nebraskense]
MAATAGVPVTAAFGAVARAVATNKGQLNDPFAEPLVRAAGVDHFVRLLDDDRYAADDTGSPRFLDICAAHTRFVDEFVAEAGRAGLRQVVILVSGLDTRPYRLWWPPGTAVYEIDRPEVLDFKAEVLRGLGAELAASRRAVCVDVHQDWPAALRRVGFDATSPTVWIAEQLLIGYLTPGLQDRLLQGVTAMSAAGSRFAADHMPTWTPLQLEAERSFVDGWHRQGLDVDLASLTHAGQYHYVPEYLAANGWETVQRNVTDLLGAMGLPGRRRGPGGTEFVPEYLTATRV